MFTFLFYFVNIYSCSKFFNKGENKLKEFLQGLIGGLIVFGFPLFIWQLSDPTFCVDNRFFTSYPVAINQLKECIHEPTQNHR